MSVPDATAVASWSAEEDVMRHFLYDWNQWSIAERIAAIAMVIGALMIPAALAAV
jgi:hypothetical protein